MLIKTFDKWEATHAFINTWLKDNTYYCNNCDSDYASCCSIPHPILMKRTLTEGSETKEAVVLHCKNCGKEVWQCCENPQIGTNKDHTLGAIKQNREIQKSRHRDTATNESKTMRWGLSIPPRLYQVLVKYFKDSYQEKFIDNKKDLHAFMRKFPQFKIPERI